MGDFGHIKRCLDLQEQDVVDAIAERASTRALLEHMAKLAAADTGAAKVLLLLARMATSACDWIDGDLFVDLIGDSEVTVVELLSELGGGLRERVFPPIAFKVPLAEFERAIDRVPHMVAPLGIKAKSNRRITLAVTETVRKTTRPPPSIEISTDSLFVRAPAPPTPREVREEAVAAPLPVVTGRSSAPRVVAGTPAIAPPAAAGKPVPKDSMPPIGKIDSGWDD